uniref:ceramide kinase-like protein isoform X2 n=1 Tax=Doryrhamphus excisus TaxID=161450 RepID=UPI0025AE1169|nr:ceramide kinase-like protein isoform X2 [Doryrhamphus excisus]
MSTFEDDPREERKKKKKKKKSEEKLSVTAKEEEENEEQKPEVNSSECVLLRGIFKVGKKSHDVLLTSTTLTWTPIMPESPTGFSSRPRCVKVFINPSSHKKEAVHIYREHVAPLFKMADVRTDITVTEMRGHALSVMKELKLDEFDGVVCVGGDGSVAELCHALVLRAQLDAGSPDSPVSAGLPLGIIPAGSTDVVSCSVHGVRDPVTAAMHIILGHLQQVDMCSFSSQGQLLRFGFSAMFGFGGRSLAWAEKKRWMPSSRRREYALVKTLARLRADHCQLSFQASNTNTLTEQLNQEQEQHQNGDLEGAESWTTNQGLYLSISIMAIPCLSPHAPRGLAPNTRLANGSAELIAVGDTSRSEFIKHLKRYSTSSGQFNSSFVETHAVSAVRLCPRTVIGCSEEESEDDSRMTAIIQSETATVFPWNIDGELVEIPNEVLIRVHPGLITLYGEEVPEAESNVSCSCI